MNARIKELAERYEEALAEKNKRLKVFTGERGTMTAWHTAGIACEKADRELNKALLEEQRAERNRRYNGFALRDANAHSTGYGEPVEA